MPSRSSTRNDTGDALDEEYGDLHATKHYCRVQCNAPDVDLLLRKDEVQDVHIAISHDFVHGDERTPLATFLEEVPEHVRVAADRRCVHKVLRDLAPVLVQLFDDVEVPSLDVEA